MEIVPSVSVLLAHPTLCCCCFSSNCWCRCAFALVFSFVFFFQFSISNLNFNNNKPGDEQRRMDWQKQKTERALMKFIRKLISNCKLGLHFACPRRKEQMSANLQFFSVYLLALVFRFWSEVTSNWGLKGWLTGFTLFFSSIGMLCFLLILSGWRVFQQIALSRKIWWRRRTLMMIYVQHVL